MINRKSESHVIADIVLSEEILSILILSDRHKMILEKRYKERLTLEEIASEFNLSRERIRQINEQAIRYIISRIHTLKNEYVVLKRLKHSIKDLEAENANLKKKIEYYKSITPAADIDLLDIDLQTCSLSIRAKNSLKSANITKMRDLIQHKLSEIMELKNTGLKTVKEIEFLVASCGLKFKE